MKPPAGLCGAVIAAAQTTEGNSIMTKTTTRPQRTSKPIIATPTHEAYAELQQAYDFFNAQLFNGELPPCLITLQRKGKKVMGYYSATRFAHRTETERHTDEIAMNPLHFKTMNVVEVLQTLVHEMCHLWQFHCGTPSRKSYHNKEWAAKMEAIGLMPSSTGQPGGNKVGQSMGDYVIAGGAFEHAATQLISQGFRLSWYDRAADIPEPTPPGEGDGDGADGDGEAEEPATPSGKRVKFTCPKCNANAWGKGSLKLVCGTDGATFIPTE